MSEVFDALIRLLLPEGILGYFGLIKAGRDVEGLHTHTHLQEKDIASEGLIWL